MIRDITIGQYYPADSILHKLDPRVKLIGTFLYIVSMFLFESFWGFLVVGVFLFSIIQLSKVPIKFIVRGYAKRAYGGYGSRIAMYIYRLS